MKPPWKKTGAGRSEAKGPNVDASCDEKLDSGDGEDTSKSKKKRRKAKLRREAANQAITVKNEIAQERQRVAEVTRQIDETNLLLGEVLRASDDLEAALNDMRARHAESQAREASLERALEQAERAGKAGKEQIANLQAILSGERQRAAELSDTLTALQNRLVIEQDHMSALIVRAAAADASSTRERLQVECVRAVLAATESKLAEDLTQAARTESELRATRRDLGATQAALAEQQLRSSTLAQDLAQTLADKSAARDEAARLSTALAEQLAIARDLRADADKERQTETRTSAVLERREQEIAALLNSTSWRLSGPWRAYRRQLSRLRRLLHGKRTNPLFDRAWYLRQYRDVKESEIDAYDHYLRYGVGEGRNPNPLFDTIWYLQKMSHVADK